MNKKASVLMISLWVMAILVVFALGLGHRAAINLRLSRYQRDSLKAYYLAKAGINKAVSFLDSENDSFDTLSEPWATGKDATDDFIFKDIELDEGSKETFTVGYRDKGGVYHCMTDEESRINLNFGDKFGRRALKELLVSAEFPEPQAELLVTRIENWISSGLRSAVEDDPPLKMGEFKVKEELVALLELFYRGQVAGNPVDKVQAAYDKLKDKIGIRASDSKININTALDDVLRAVIMASLPDNMIPAVAEDVAARIINFRKGGGVFDSPAGIAIKLLISDKDQLNLIGQLTNQVIAKSQVFEIVSTGTVNGVRKEITAVYDRGKEKKIYSWREN